MFNFERETLPNSGEKVVACQRAERSLVQRQRDIFETHKHHAFAVAFYMTGSEVVADEVLEGTFVDAFRAAEEPSGEAVDQALVGQLREQLTLDEVVAPADPVSGPGLGGRNVKRTELELALRQLPPNERFVFLMRDVEGYDAARVATLLSTDSAQVERTLLSARIRLRTALVTAAPRVAAA